VIFGGHNNDGPKSDPLWWEDAPPPVIPRQVLPARKVDVAVVGAGYTGLAAAIELARAGRSVVVLDAGDPGHGASTRNGGLLIGELRIGFARMIDSLGLERAKAIYGEAARAVKHTTDFIRAENIDCQLSQIGRFCPALTRDHYEDMGHEADLLNKHFRVEIGVVPPAGKKREVGTDLYIGGRIRPDVTVLHPALFHLGLLNRAQNAGALVLGRTPVLAIERQSDHLSVRTERGTILAGEVVMATNGHTGAIVPWLQRRVVPVRGSMIATEPLAEDLMDRLMPGRRVVMDRIHLDNYFRPSPDGRRIVFCGRARTRGKDPRKLGAALKTRLAEIFPDLAETRVSHAWTGISGCTFDLLPRVGSHDGIHYALGYCGIGLAWGPYLGHRAARMVLGDDHRSILSDLEFPGRSLLFRHPLFLPSPTSCRGLGKAKTHKD
jgi:glycine/D-amino acid oxidase-like deaminating enzyme